MKTDEKILRYFSGMMSEIEEKEFQNTINNSESLKKQIAEIEVKLNKMKEINILEIDESYFNKLRLKIHDRVSAKKKKVSFIVNYAFAFAITILMIFLISKDFIDDKQNYIDEPISLDEYFSALETDFILQSDLEQFDEYEEFSTEEKLNFVSITSQISNSDDLLFFSEANKQIISELEKKNFLKR